MRSVVRHSLLPGAVALGITSPTPSPGQLDSATQGEQQLERFQQLGSSINLAIQHALVFAIHALTLFAELLHETLLRCSRFRLAFGRRQGRPPSRHG